MALEEIDSAIHNAAADGYLGPQIIREKDRWPHAVFFRAVIAQYEITGAARYLNTLLRHYQSSPHPMDWDRDVTGVEALGYLYQQTNDSTLLEQAEDLYQRFYAFMRGFNWMSYRPIHVVPCCPGNVHGVSLRRSNGLSSYYIAPRCCG